MLEQTMYCILEQDFAAESNDLDWIHSQYSWEDGDDLELDWKMRIYKRGSISFALIHSAAIEDPNATSTLYFTAKQDPKEPLLSVIHQAHSPVLLSSHATDIASLYEAAGLCYHKVFIIPYD